MIKGKTYHIYSYSMLRVIHSNKDVYFPSVTLLFSYGLFISDFLRTLCMHVRVNASVDFHETPTFDRLCDNI